ncbi:unnamed protein product [Leptosia nina]|uniref:ribonuclease H n=1 Tax=Leptosia nina TaxID=320188 RepID=A0AAV1JME6_9NEOP
MSKSEILPQFSLSYDSKILHWDKIIIHRISTIEHKAQLSISDIKQRTEDFMDALYMGYARVFTDGSKTSHGSGCAFYDESADFGAKFRIKHPCIPIMGVELVAIMEAIHYIESTTHRKIVILTDSKSGLQHLIGCARGNSVGRNETYLIIKCIHRLIRNGVEVRLQWIPSHVGIMGNEIADSLAFEALKNGIPLDTTPHYSDHLSKVKMDNYIQFKSYFDDCSKSKGIWYKSIVNVPPRIPWFSSLNLTRKDLVICFRARTYHLPLNKFKFIMKKRDDPNCERCSRVEDFLHLVLECKINEQPRLELLSDSQCSARDFL